MAVLIKVPRLGWSMDEGTFGEWLLPEGAIVKPGDLLFTLEGDKSSQDIESFDSGFLHIPAAAPRPGEKVIVGQPLGYLLRENEKPLALPPQSVQPAGSQPFKPSTAPRVAGPAARRLAREQGVDIQQVATPDPRGRVLREDILALPAAEISTPDPRTNRHRSTPRARRKAEQMGIDIQQIKGSGKNGRVREKDIHPFRPPVTTTEPLPTASGKWIEPNQKRKTIAYRMQESANRCVPVTLNTRAHAGKLVQFRETLRLQQKNHGQAAASLNDILLWLTGRALAENPGLNCCWVNQKLYQYDRVNIAFAVDTKAGLCAPVIKDANLKSLQEISALSAELIEKARRETLTDQEQSGGTFTLSNLGMHGIDHFTPVVNLHQSAILGIGRILEEPVIEAGELVAGKIVGFSLTFDHRAVDGAPAAKWLQDFCQSVEELT